MCHLAQGMSESYEDITVVNTFMLIFRVVTSCRLACLQRSFDFYLGSYTFFGDLQIIFIPPFLHNNLTVPHPDRATYHRTLCDLEIGSTEISLWSVG